VICTPKSGHGAQLSFVNLSQLTKEKNMRTTFSSDEINVWAREVMKAG